MTLIMFSLYRIPDNKACRCCGLFCRTGLSGKKKSGPWPFRKYAAQAAVVRSIFRLSAAEPRVYGSCRQLTELRNKHI